MDNVFNKMMDAKWFRYVLPLIVATIVVSCQNGKVAPIQPTFIEGKEEVEVGTQDGIIEMGGKRYDTLVFSKSVRFADNSKGDILPASDFAYRVTVWNDPTSTTLNSTYFNPIYTRNFTFNELKFSGSSDKIFFKLAQKRSEASGVSNYPALAAGRYKMVLQALSDKGVLSYITDANVLDFEVKLSNIKLNKVFSHAQVANEALVGEMIYLYGAKLNVSTIEIELDGKKITPVSKFSGFVGTNAKEFNAWGNTYLSFKIPATFSTNSSAKLMLKDGLQKDSISFNLKRGVQNQYPQLDFSLSTASQLSCISSQGFQVIDAADASFKNEYKKCIVAEYNNGDIITIKGNDISSATTFAFKGLNGVEEALTFTKNADGSYQHTIANFEKIGGQFVVKYSPKLIHETGFYVIPKATTAYSSTGTTSAANVAVFGDSVYITATSAYGQRIWDSVSQLNILETLYDKTYSFVKSKELKQIDQFKLIKGVSPSNNKLGLILPTYGKSWVKGISANWGANGAMVIPVSLSVKPNNESYLLVNNTFDITSMTPKTGVLKDREITINGTDLLSKNDTVRIMLGDTVVTSDHIVSATKTQIKFKYPAIYYKGPVTFLRTSGHLSLIKTVNGFETKRDVSAEDDILWTDALKTKGTLAGGNLFYNGDRKLLTLKSSLSSKEYARNLMGFEFFVKVEDVPSGNPFIRERIVKKTTDLLADKASVTAQEVVNALGLFPDEMDIFNGKKVKIRGIATNYYGGIIKDVTKEIIMDNKTFFISKVRPTLVKKDDIIRVNFNNFTSVNNRSTDITVTFGTYVVPESDIVLANNNAIHFRASNIRNMIGKVKIAYTEAGTGKTIEAVSRDIWKYDLKTDFEYNTFKLKDGKDYFTVSNHILKDNKSSISSKVVFKTSTNLLSGNKDHGNYSIVFRKLGSIEAKDTYPIIENKSVGSTFKELTLDGSDFEDLESDYQPGAPKAKTLYNNEWNYSASDGFDLAKAGCAGIPAPKDQFDYLEPATKFIVDFIWKVTLDGKEETIVNSDTVETLPKYAILPPFDGSFSNDIQALKTIACYLKNDGNLNWRTESTLGSFTGVTPIGSRVRKINFSAIDEGTLEGGIVTEALARLTELDEFIINQEDKNVGKLSIKVDAKLATLTKLQKFEIMNVAGTGEIPSAMCTARPSFGHFALQKRDGTTFNDVNVVKDCKLSKNFDVAFSDKQAAVEWADAFGLKSTYSAFRSTNPNIYTTTWNASPSSLPPVFKYVNNSGLFQITSLELTDADVLDYDSLDNNRFLSNMEALTSMIITKQSKFEKIPKVLFKLNLETLHLHENKLSGVLPEMQYNWNKLKSLYLYGNELTGTLADKSCESREYYDSFQLQKLDGIITNDKSKLRECDVKSTTSTINFRDAQYLYMAKSGLHSQDFDKASSTADSGPFKDVQNLKNVSDFNVNVDATGRITKIHFHHPSATSSGSSNKLKGDSASIAFAVTYLDSLSMLRQVSFKGQDNLGGASVPSQIPSDFGRLDQLDSLNLNSTNLYGKLDKRTCENRPRFTSFDLLQTTDHRLIDCDFLDKSTGLSHRDKQALIDLSTLTLKKSKNLWPRFYGHTNANLDTFYFGMNSVSANAKDISNYLSVSVRNGRVNAVYFNLWDYFNPIDGTSVSSDDELQAMPNGWNLMQGLDSLESLYITGVDGANKFLSFNPHSKFNFDKLSKLSLVHIGKSKINAQIDKILESAHLTHLYLPYNEITSSDFSVNVKDNIRNLVALDLRGNSLTTINSVPFTLKEMYLDDNENLDADLVNVLTTGTGNAASIHGLRMRNLGLSKTNFNKISSGLTNSVFGILGYLDLQASSKGSDLTLPSTTDLTELEVLNMSKLDVTLSATTLNKLNKLYHLHAVDNKGIGSTSADKVLKIKCLFHKAAITSGDGAAEQFANVMEQAFEIDSVSVCP